MVSPHLDDAVLSCGHLLGAAPGAHVVTVFSSGPPSVDPLPEWDQASGCFRPGDDVMALRGVEDDRAMALLGAIAHRLDFWDVQYRRPAQPSGRLRRWWARSRERRVGEPGLDAAVCAALEAMVVQLPISTWLVPLGLWHPDHKCVARACLSLARRWPDRGWVVYEELPYRLEVVGEVDAARRNLESTGFAPSLSTLEPGDDRKADALRCYASQVPCLGERLQAAMASPEIYHELSSPDLAATPGR